MEAESRERVETERLWNKRKQIECGWIYVTDFTCSARVLLVMLLVPTGYDPSPETNARTVFRTINIPREASVRIEKVLLF